MEPNLDVTSDDSHSYFSYIGKSNDIYEYYCNPYWEDLFERAEVLGKISGYNSSQVPGEHRAIRPLIAKNSSRYVFYLLMSMSLNFSLMPRLRKSRKKLSKNSGGLYPFQDLIPSPFNFQENWRHRKSMAAGLISFLII